MITLPRGGAGCKVNFAGCVMVIMSVIFLQHSGMSTESRESFALFWRHSAEIPLDASVCCGINILTQSHRDVGGTPGQAQTTRSQGRGATKALQPQPTSGPRRRSVVHRIRLLRRPRSRPGEVRDGSTGECRGAAREPQRRRLWFLAPLLLSGADRLEGGRPPRAGAQATGASPLTQAEHGGGGLPAARASRGWIAELVRSRAAGQGTLRAQGSSSQRRASTRTTRKKTSVTSSAASRTSDRSVTVYEELRGCVLAGGSTSGNHVDVLLLIREGIAAWMARSASRAVAHAPPADRAQRAAIAPAVCNEIHAGLVRGLASMALASRGERSV